MADTLSDERREAIWEALSDAFVDNEVDYRYIASRVADVSPIELKEIFFTEVAPHCGPNMMSPIPPIWGVFDRVELAKGIRAMLGRARNSWIARLRYKSFVAYCKWRFQNEWQAIADELGQHEFHN